MQMARNVYVAWMKWWVRKGVKPMIHIDTAGSEGMKAEAPSNLSTRVTRYLNTFNGLIRRSYVSQFCFAWTLTLLCGSFHGIFVEMTCFDFTSVSTIWVYNCRLHAWQLHVLWCNSFKRIAIELLSARPKFVFGWCGVVGPRFTVLEPLALFGSASSCSATSRLLL